MVWTNINYKLIRRGKSEGTSQVFLGIFSMDYIHLLGVRAEVVTEFLGCKYILFPLLLLYSIDSREHYLHAHPQPQ